jgi:hypothetical protein
MAAVALAGVGSAGCGDEDPCANKTCTFGTCDSANGQCVNVEDCRVDSECLPGYLCESGGTCEPQTTCQDDSDCEQGICEAETCVNPPSCSSDEDCVERTFCGADGTCQRDPCNDVTCNRGMCERGTDDCISIPSCTQENQQYNCVRGEKCASGTCEPMESYCDDVTCERGVCNYEAGGCINASDCEGDNANCREGFFCNSMDQCAPNLCVQDNVNCGANGVCQPASGECQNAVSCESNDQCLGNHWCVDGSCVLQTTACGTASGDGGCPGGQTCEYDPEGLQTNCKRPETCDTSLDCLPDPGSDEELTQCGGRTCLSLVQCSADRFEPSDTAEEAVVVAEAASSGLIDGVNLCGGEDGGTDTDVYTLTTTNFVSGTTEGQIVIDVAIPQQAIGLGEMTMQVTGPTGRTFSEDLGARGQKGEMSLNVPFGIPEGGTYEIVLSPGEQFNETTGLAYDMSVSIEEEQGSGGSACGDVSSIPTLDLGERNNGSITEETSSDVTPTCLPSEETAGDDIYAFTIDRPQEVRVTVSGDSSSDNPAVALRRRCGVSGTELACADMGGEGKLEWVEQVLAPGTYYVIVQAGAGGEGPGLEDYTVRAETTAVTSCAPGDNYCANGQEAFRCTPDGGRYRGTTCDAGCNPMTGRCNSPQGDFCSDAEALSMSDAPQGQTNDDGEPYLTRSAEFLQLQNSYAPRSASCIDEVNPAVGGPDKVYEVQIPANRALTVDADYENEVEGSIYVAESCPDIGETCQKWSSDSSLTVSNFTDESVTRRVVVDTAAGQAVAGADVRLTFEELICQTDEQACNESGNVATCNDTRTAYSQVNADCGNLGCSESSSEAPTCSYGGDTCENPIDATAAARSQSGGVTYDATFGDYSADYNDTGCSGSPYDSGQDAVFRVDLNANETVIAALTATGPDSLLYNDPSIRIGTTCGDMTESSCIDSQEATDPAGSSTATASVSYSTGGTAETVYITTDSDDDGENVESFSLNINITSTSP